MIKIVLILCSLVLLTSCKSEGKNEVIKEVSEAQIRKNLKTIKPDSVKGNFAGGTLLRITDFPSEYIPPRKVDIWLPANYSEEKKYAVLYMHDGQMLFDGNITWNNQEWMVDEISTNLMNDSITKEFIVVAPYNINDLRHSEYFPQKPFESLPERAQDSLFEMAKNDNFKFDTLNSDNYLKFLVKELKQYIDDNYSVYTNRENTFIAGSSMGGLISMYAICEYPKVFGGAACLSTHWPGAHPSDNDLIPDAFFSYMEKEIPSPRNHKLYFDYGTETLDKFYPKYANKVNKIFKDKGYDKSNFRNLKFEGADHSEVSWQKRLDIPLTFLLKNK